MEDNSKEQENLKGITSISENENNFTESVGLKNYSDLINQIQPNKEKQKEENSSLNNDSELINSISKIIEEMINKLFEFSETLKSELSKLNNTNETCGEIKDEQNSKIEN